MNHMVIKASFSGIVISDSDECCNKADEIRTKEIRITANVMMDVSCQLRLVLWVDMTWEE